MEKYYKMAPHFLQNIAISLFNFFHYRIRYGNLYKEYRSTFDQNRHLSLLQLKELQKQKLIDLFNHATTNSSFYRNKYKRIKTLSDLNKLSQLPLVSKEEIRKNISSIRTIPLKYRQVFETGGTTGLSMHVVYTKNNLQERFAMLDSFRGQYNYKLGCKSAWFSGKNIITYRDLKTNRFWKTDYLYNIRYYSSFHLKKDYLKFYLENLIKYKPQFLIGYPSCMIEIAEFGLSQGYDFPSNVVKAIFPTSETFSSENQQSLELFFKAKVYDQYASSEGAPFITECKYRNLHMQLQSGVFEVLDCDNVPSNEGRLVVTSFTSYGTPLIRYDIGDRVILGKGSCTCGDNNPLIEKISGREVDFVYSLETGKIFLGNISNTLKKVKGVKKFQVIQNSLDSIDINLIINPEYFTKEMEIQFLNNWRDRLGLKMGIKINVINHIPAAVSGKYQMVINNIKHLLD